ncbi:MAG: hypothetical protein NWR72_03240 [Bacteroidia bacterium]|nr:hypothetical protein [Bacteroidia bacterium]
MKKSTSPSQSRRSGSFPIFWVLIVVGCVFLAITNPDEESFKTFTKNSIPSELNQGADAELLETLLGKGLALVSNLTSYRENRFLFSQYHINVAGTPRQYLGIAGQFIRID